MSALMARLQEDLVTARKGQDKPSTLLLSTILADIKNRRIELMREPTDDDVIEVLRRGIKRRRESIEAYQKGARADLVAKEQFEVDRLERYLPAADLPGDDPRSGTRGDRWRRDDHGRRHGQGTPAIQGAGGRQCDQYHCARGARGTRVTLHSVRS